MPEDKKTPPAPTESRQPDTIAERTWGPFWSLRAEIDDVFDDFYRGGSAAFRPRIRGIGRPFSADLPSLDVIDKDNEVKLCAELPGMTESDIDIDVSDSRLTVSGEKKEEIEEGDREGAHYVAERRFGSFTRSVALPDGIDQDAIEATFKNGVLTVHLPKKPEARKPGRRIEVRQPG